MCYANIARGCKHGATRPCVATQHSNRALVVHLDHGFDDVINCVDVCPSVLRLIGIVLDRTQVDSCKNRDTRLFLTHVCSRQKHTYVYKTEAKPETQRGITFLLAVTSWHHKSLSTGTYIVKIQ